MPPRHRDGHARSTEEDAASVSELLNRAWHTLKDKGRRAMYDSGRVLFGKSSLFKDPFTGVPLSKNARPDLDVALFVDEGRCIGCHQCKHAPHTFKMEPHFNVARVETQWADSEEDLETAVACCPKDCIHTVPKADRERVDPRSQPRQRIVACSVESMSGKGRGLEEITFRRDGTVRARRTEMMRDARRRRHRAKKRGSRRRRWRWSPRRRDRVVGWVLQSPTRRRTSGENARAIVPLARRVRQRVPAPSAVLVHDLRAAIDA